MGGAHKKRLAKERQGKKASSSSEDKSPKSASPIDNASNEHLSPPTGVDGNRDPSVARSRSGSNTSEGGQAGGGQAMITGLTVTPGQYKNLDLGAFAAGAMAGYGPNPSLPRRPKQGNKTGREMAITLNSFPVQQFPTIPVYQYDVLIGNGSEKRGLIRAIWESKTLQGKFQSNQEIWIFDGNRIAWSHGGPPLGSPFRVKVNLDQEKGRAPRKDATGKDKPEDVHTVVLTRTKQVNFSALHGYLEGKSDWSDGVLEAINFLDHLMREQPSKTFTSIKRNFFARGQQRVPLGGGVEAFKGVYSSVRPALIGFGQSPGLSVNVDVANTSFWSTAPLHLTAKDVCGARDANHLGHMLQAGKGAGSKDPKFALLKRLARLRVYQKNGNADEDKKKPLVILRFLNQTAAQFTFTKHVDGKDVTTSIEKHFRDKGQRLQHPDLPVVQMTKERIVLPMEFCNILENQRYNFKLGDRQTAEMIKVAVTVPDVRWGHIQEGLRMLNWGEDRNLATFGMKISQQPTKVKARVLPNPKVLFNQRSRENPVDPRTSGRWDLRGKVFLEPHPTPLNSWGVCILTTGRYSASKEQVEQFLLTFISVFKGHGGQVQQNKPVIIQSGDAGQSVQELWNAAGNQAKSAPQLLVFIVPDRDSQVYQRIKKSCECRFGVVSQVMQAAHVQKNQQQYCSNVSMKVNAKLGGVTARAVGMKGTGSWFNRPTMVIGGDVSHAAPGADAPSIAAITMSWDRQCLRYIAGVETNGSRVELITTANIHGVMGPMFDNWVKSVGGGRFPEHIIYVRDGVSERQYPQVINQEVHDIKKLLQSKNPKANPKMTVIIAGKRHHIRFFPDKGTGDRNNNPLPGTLVEAGVTHPFEYDFYLCAHSAIKGTARPVHYHVILDEAEMSVENLQNWLYESSYQFVRSTTPVSMFPAVYYADLAAGRAIAHLNQPSISSGPEDKSHTRSSPMDIADIKPLLSMPPQQNIAGTMWYV